VLDEAEPLALRLTAPGVEVRASSGAAAHLVRRGEAGLIDVWPVAELALFDTNDWRKPANDFAVATRIKASAEPPEPQDAEQAPVKGDPAPVEADAPAEMDEPLTVKSLSVTPTEVITMSDQIEETPKTEAPAPDLSAVLAELQSLKAMLNAPEKLGEMLTAKSAPAVMKAAGLGDPDPDEDFMEWVKTGRGRIKAHSERVEIKGRKSGELYYKGALQYGTTTEGQYLVPAGVYGAIIEQRKEQSLVDRLGVTTFNTDSYIFYIPTEGTAMTRFTIGAEESDLSAAENEPAFSRAAVTKYDFWKLVKVSKQLTEMENSGLESYLARGFGNAWAATENYYVQIGAGTTEPKGAFTGGTAALTLDAVGAIGASEVPELLGKLKIPYRSGAVLVCNRTTAAYLAGLFGTNAFSFRTPPQNVLTVGGEDLGIGYPVIPTEDAPGGLDASDKSLLFGNFSFYAWVRGNSLSVQRLTELYAQTGQIGLLANFRAGGDVMQAEAFQIASHPTA
jgi:HK97 family phage major capsid protein